MPPADAPALSPAPSQFRLLTMLSLVLLAIFAAWATVDGRTVGDSPVWMKPLKFALGFAVLFATLALLERRQSPALRGGRMMRIIAGVMAAAFLSEMAWITFQATRAEPSHYNLSTPFHAVMYLAVMGGGAVALVVSVAVIGWLAARDPGSDLGPGLRTGVLWGFALGCGLTLVTAGTLSAGPGHFTGLHPPGAPVLPLLGWSGVTGDLRPAHFLALHAMQAVPLLGLWLDRRGDRQAARHTRAAAIGWAVLTLAVFAQALAGFPLIPLG